MASKLPSYRLQILPSKDEMVIEGRSYNIGSFKKVCTIWFSVELSGLPVLCLSRQILCFIPV